MPKLVVRDRAFLAGNLYLDKQPEAMSLWYYNPEKAEINFRVVHESALQTITVSGENQSHLVIIDTTQEWFSTELLNPGIYQITAEKGNVIVEARGGYFAFTADSIFLPASSHNGYDDGKLIINTTLRGQHTLWTNITDGFLSLEVIKQDLNWYEGPDELSIEVYPFNGELRGKTIIPDGGDEDATQIMGPLQSGSLKIEGMEPGTYRIELKSGSDLLIRRIEINQAKLVVDRRVFPVGMNRAYFKEGLTSDPVNLYGNNFTTGQLRFRVVHAPALQRMSLHGNDFEVEVDINETHTDFSTSLKPGDYRLDVPKQNVIIETKGYLSFTPESFFLPQRARVVDLKYDLDWLRENVDNIVIDYSDYSLPT